jgi:hypothetical protein
MMAPISRAATTLLVALGTSAPPQEQYAASAFVSLVTASGVAAKLVSAAVAAGQPHVAIGTEAALAANVSSADLASLGRDDALCRSGGGVLVLTGGLTATVAQPRGTINAVYELLRRFGYRLFAPDGPPVLPELSADALLHPPSSVGCGPAAWRPSVAVRNLNGFASAPYHRDLRSSTFAVANHLNGAQARSVSLNATYGGSEYYAGGFVHTSFDLVPPCPGYEPGRACPTNDTTALNSTFPEWFSWAHKAGTMQHTGQLCWMDPAMLQYLIARVRSVLRADPSATIVSVSQNDNGNYCTRAADQTVIDEEGSPMGPMLRAINAVAANISTDFPHVTVSTLSYQYTRPPPRQTVPRANVRPPPPPSNIPNPTV